MAATSFVFVPRQRNRRFRRGPISHTPRRTPYEIRQVISTQMRELWGASQSGDIDTVRALLRRKPDLVHSENATGWRPLHFASRCGQGQVMGELIEAGADVNATNQEGNTALHEAAYQGHLRAVKTLVESGADPNLHNKDKQSGLHLAAVHNRQEVVETLVRLGTNPHMRDQHGKSPSDLARMFGNGKIVDFLEAQPVPEPRPEEVDVNSSAVMGDEDADDSMLTEVAEDDESTSSAELSAGDDDRSDESSSETKDERGGPAGADSENRPDTNMSVTDDNDETHSIFSPDDSFARFDTTASTTTSATPINTPAAGTGGGNAPPTDPFAFASPVSPSPSPIRRPKLAHYTPGNPSDADVSGVSSGYGRHSPSDGLGLGLGIGRLDKSPSFSFTNDADADRSMGGASSASLSQSGGRAVDPRFSSKEEFRKSLAMAHTPPDYSKDFEERGKGTRLSFDDAHEPSSPGDNDNARRPLADFDFLSPEVPKASQQRSTTATNTARRRVLGELDGNRLRRPGNTPSSSRRNLLSKSLDKSRNLLTPNSGTEVENNSMLQNASMRARRGSLTDDSFEERSSSRLFASQDRSIWSPGKSTSLRQEMSRMNPGDFDLSRYSNTARADGDFASSASAMEVDSDADGDVFLPDGERGAARYDADGTADLKEDYEYDDADSDMDIGDGVFDTSFNESFDSTTDVPEFSQRVSSAPFATKEDRQEGAVSDERRPSRKRRGVGGFLRGCVPDRTVVLVVVFAVAFAFVQLKFADKIAPAVQNFCDGMWN